MHIDLHETTYTDESEFRPAVAARDGKVHESGPIPVGFYKLGDTENPQPEFQAAIIAAVEKVTHIAQPDANGGIIGCKITQNGVINDACRELGRCTNAACRSVSAVEQRPDHPVEPGIAAGAGLFPIDLASAVEHDQLRDRTNPEEVVQPLVAGD